MSRRTPVRNGLCRWWKRNAELRLNRRSCKGLLTAFLFLLLALVPHRAKAPPMEEWRELPGTSVGTANSYWAAPFVRVSTEAVGSIHGMTATWYGQGDPVKTRAVDGVQPGFVTAREDGQNVIFGINEDWKIVLPKEPNPNDVMATGFITSTADSHVFVHEVSPDRKQVFENIYVGGVLAGKWGPFLSYLGRGVHVGSDGSTALIAWKDSAKTGAQIILTDAEGKLSAQIDCEETDKSPIPAPNGTGALLEAPWNSEFRGFFAWYTREGKVRSLQVAPNGDCKDWVPGTQKSLFTTGSGDDTRYRMIDWASGRELWDIPCPADGHALAIGLTPRLVLFDVSELYELGGPRAGGTFTLRNSKKDWTRAFYAIGVDDGKVVSRFKPHFSARLNLDGRDRFSRLGDKLYFVTRDEVVELSEDDILAGKNGWERPAAGAK